MDVQYLNPAGMHLVAAFALALVVAGGNAVDRDRDVYKRDRAPRPRYGANE